MMKCHYCHEENEHLALVNSKSVANALVFVCLECAKNHSIDVDKVSVNCNECGKLLVIGKLGNVYMENIFTDTFVLYCRKCSINTNFRNIEKKFLFLSARNKKRVKTLLKKVKISTFFTIEEIHKKVMQKYPFTELFLVADKKIHIVPDDKENYDEICEMINVYIKAVADE